MASDGISSAGLRQALRGRKPYGPIGRLGRRTVRRVREIARTVFPSGFVVPKIVPISSTARESFYRTIDGKPVVIHDFSYTHFLYQMLTLTVDPQPPMASFSLFNLWIAETFLARSQRKIALEIAEVTHAKRHLYDKKLDDLPEDAPFYNPNQGLGQWYRLLFRGLFESPFDAFILGHEIGHAAQGQRLPVMGIELPYDKIEKELRDFSSGYDYDILYPINATHDDVPEISQLGDDGAHRKLFSSSEIHADFSGFLIAAKESVSRGVPLQEFCQHFSEIFYFFQVLATLNTFAQHICLTIDESNATPAARVQYPIYALRFLGVCQAISIAYQRSRKGLESFLSVDLAPLQDFMRQPHEMEQSWGRMMALWKYARWSFWGSFDARSCSYTECRILFPQPFRKYVLDEDWLMYHFEEKPNESYPDMLLVGFAHTLRYTRWIAANLDRVASAGLGCYRAAAAGMTDSQILKLLWRPFDDATSSYPFSLKQEKRGQAREKGTG